MAKPPLASIHPSDAVCRKRRCILTVEVLFSVEVYPVPLRVDLLAIVDMGQSAKEHSRLLVGGRLFLFVYIAGHLLLSLPGYYATNFIDPDFPLGDNRPRL